MNVGSRSLFLDCFRTTDVDRDVKVLAARGLLSPRAYDQLGIVMLLCEDADDEIRATAEAMSRAFPREELSAFLARADVPDTMRAFFAARGVEPATTASGDPDPPPFIVVDAESPWDQSFEDDATETRSGVADAESESDQQRSTTERIATMSIPERLSLAMKGTREERAVLIRDSNKLVSTAVIASPKLTESEVESIARMTNVSEEILRVVAMNRSWTKNYAVVSALAKNPKTPVAISINLLPRLHEKDLRMLSTNRNVPEVLRSTARTKLVFEAR